MIKAKEKSRSAITAYFGFKRDAYYKYKHREGQRSEVENKVVAIVKKRRRYLPREGVRKLTKSFDKEFANAHLKIGWDTLFNILRKHNMLTCRKEYSYRTTNSLYSFYKYKNIIKNL